MDKTQQALHSYVNTPKKWLFWQGEGKP